MKTTTDGASVSSVGRRKTVYWVSRGVRILDQILDHVVRPTTPRCATCYVSGRVSRDGEGSLLNADFGALFVSDDRRDLYCCDFDLATIQDEIKSQYSVVLEKQVILDLLPNAFSAAGDPRLVVRKGSDFAMFSGVLIESPAFGGIIDMMLQSMQPIPDSARAEALLHFVDESFSRELGGGTSTETAEQGAGRRPKAGADKPRSAVGGAKVVSKRRRRR